MSEQKIWKKHKIRTGDTVYFPQKKISASCLMRMNIYTKQMVKYVFQDNGEMFEEAVHQNEVNRWKACC